jgi:16S rRNA (guanine527-N7)-methyltransferase
LTPDPLPPAPPPEAADIFGDALDVATRYAEALATDGVVRGLIGPREAGRIWDRHLLNCAVVAELIPSDETVLDIGSGAGLPGVPLALARADLRVTLLEPMARRCAFLDEMIDALGLASRVSVVRGRAPDAASVIGEPSGIVVARAVAPLGRLVAMALPMVRRGGVMLAMRGGRAAEEVAADSRDISAQGGRDVSIELCGEAQLREPTTVVRIVRGRQAASRYGIGTATRTGDRA